MSAEGDLKDIAAIGNNEDIMDVKTMIENLESDEIILFFTDFHYELTEELKNFLVSYGFDHAVLDVLLNVSSGIFLIEIKVRVGVLPILIEHPQLFWYQNAHF